MSKTTWKKNLGGSLTIYLQERSKYYQVSFYVSPHYKSNGMFRMSLKPITTKAEAIKQARELYRDFDFKRYEINPLTTTFHEVALKAFELHKKKYRVKELHKIKHNTEHRTTAEGQWTRYEKEIKPRFKNINIKDRDALLSAKYELVEQLKTTGNTDGKLIEDNTIDKYLGIIRIIEKHAVGMGLLFSVIDNPPTERRSNPRPAYRMLELKKITDEIMNEYRSTEDYFYLELHDYIQFLIASPTRPGMETINLTMNDCKILTNKDNVKILRVNVNHTKTGQHAYTSSPEFLRHYGIRLYEKFDRLKDEQYLWFSNSQKSRGTINERVRHNFVRISKKLGLYNFNGKERPMTSIRHASMQRMRKEGLVDDIARIHNTSNEMANKHYYSESDDNSIIEEHDRIYAKRLKGMK